MTGSELARTLRTVRFLRPRQVVGQLRHRLTGSARPVVREGPPPRLGLAAASRPFLGPPAHAYTDGWRRFRLLNREVVFPERPDWDHLGEGPLWSYHLHQFDYARRPGLSPEARRALVLDWIARHPRGVGWEPGPISLRAQSWIKLLLTPGALPADPAARDRIASSLAAQLDTLAANLETHLLANHYLSNLVALVLGGLAFSGGEADRWLGFERALSEELAEQVLPDGAHVERSPMYHSLVLESLCDLANVAAAAGARAPAPLVRTLRDAIARMLGALAVMTHPDGEIALFGDSAFGIAQPPAAIAAYAAALGIAKTGPARPGVLDAAGYVRLAAGPFTLIASTAGPMPAYQPGHAHCDALAFELSVGEERVVTDTGVAEYVPGALREASRATRSHATLEIGGADQAELWASHRVGGRPRVSLGAVDPGRRFEATCAGWSTPDSVHRRVVEVGPDGVEVRDALEGRARSVRFALPLAPGLEPRLEAGRVRVRLPSGAWVRFDLPGGLRFSVERAPYFPEFGRTQDRSVLVGRGDALASARLRASVADAITKPAPAPREASRARPRPTR